MEKPTQTVSSNLGAMPPRRENFMAFDGLPRRPFPRRQTLLSEASMFRRIIFCLFLGVASGAAAAEDASTVTLAERAPDSHVVQKGDTLWGISAKFLRDPWRWPEVWRMNRSQVRDPHWIYPGQVVVLDRSGRVPRLRIGGRIGGRNAKLAPKVYSEPSEAAIPSIPQQVIEPYLTQPLILEAKGLDQAPKIVATMEDRVVVGAGDKVYAAGIDSNVKMWQVFRPLKPVQDPVTKEILGYEAFFLGNAQVVREGEPATLEILNAKQEINRGDRLVPTAKPDVVAYAPHAPEASIEGRIISLYSGINVGETGRNYIVTLNRGNRDGVEVGHVLATYRNSRDVEYRDAETEKREIHKLPEERTGLVFVFRTFERVSYALVMNSDRPVRPGDVVRTP